MIRRTLRITSLVVLAVLLAATGLTWVRSYYQADRVHGRVWGRKSFLIGSKQGRVIAVGFRSHGHPKWWKWGVYSYAVDDALSFPVGPVNQYDAKLGVGWIRNPLYFVMRPEQQRPDGSTIMIFGAASATLRGYAILIPHWLIALVTVSVIMFLVMGRRFSLRAFFVWVTIVVVFVGFAVHMGTNPPLPENDAPLPTR